MEKQVNLSLEQLCVVGAFERLMNAIAGEASMLRLIRKADAAEKLDTMTRHLEKHRADFLSECQRSIVIAQAGSIPDIQKTH